LKCGHDSLTHKSVIASPASSARFYVLVSFGVSFGDSFSECFSFAIVFMEHAIKRKNSPVWEPFDLIYPNKLSVYSSCMLIMVAYFTLAKFTPSPSKCSRGW
jgi:hypothetical protein